MNFNVRKMSGGDRPAWLEMRALLWPHEPSPKHGDAIDKVLASDQAWGFIAESMEGIPIGFAEVMIRNFANGCQTQPVPFLEGIFVKPQFRRQRIGARLVEYLETFLASQGFQEIGSDARIENHLSHLAHQAWGFSETVRVVYFRKSLNNLVRIEPSAVS